jgi:hypothetical protein
MFKILGVDGKEYGPVSAEVLRQWIADGRANAQSRVQTAGSTEWRPLSELPEFAADLAVPQSPQPPPINPSPLAAPLRVAKTSAMAISSVILGILGLITCGITALIGLVLGIVSLFRIRKSNGEISGQGIAIAGICVSGVFLLLAPVAFALFLPAIAKAKARAQTVQCANNLRQIGLAATRWAGTHQGDFPSQLILLTNQVSSPAVFSCPGDPNAHPPSDWSAFTPRNISYEFLRAGRTTDNPPTELARCPIHGHVLFSDGSVRQLR